MANNHSNLTSLFTDIADAIRSKTGGSDPIVADQFPEAIEGISSGGGSDDSWVIGDGNTHIWVNMTERVRHPGMQIAVNGTLTVDWGDGSIPDTLTGTSLASTPKYISHEYTDAGDYVITFVVDGEAQLIKNLGFGSSNEKEPYYAAVQKIEIGGSMRLASYDGFRNLCCLTDVFLPDGITDIPQYTFASCYSLKSVRIPQGVTSIGANAFYNCTALVNVAIPNSVLTIGKNAFQYSCIAGSVEFSSNLTSIPDYFCQKAALKEIVIPKSVESIGAYAFDSCYALRRIVIQDGVKSVGDRAFYQCCGYTEIEFPPSIESIANNAFAYCKAATIFDFTKHTFVPTLGGTSAFSYGSGIYKIRVPAALYDEWIAATNWSTYADYIVGV